MKWDRDAVAYRRLGGNVAVISRGVFWVLVGTVLLSPIPFGSIFPWSYTLLAVIVAVLVIAWSVTLVVSGEPPPVTVRMVWFPAVLYFGVVVWVVIQAAPWTPVAWHNPVWANTAALLGTDIDGAISVVPYATETSVMRLLTYAGIFWLALQYGRSSQRAVQVYRAVAIAGLVYAAYGLAVEFSGSQTILWYEKLRYQDNLTSTFRYKNAYATYAGLGLIATVVLLVRALGRDDYSTMGPSERLRTILTLVFEKIWPLVLTFIALVSALLLSDSRGGFFSATVALLVFAILLRISPRRALPYGKIYFAAIAVAGVFFISVSGGAVFDRFAQTDENEIRTRIYDKTVDAIAGRPLSGWGANTFESVFAQYQDWTYTTRTLRAHNEYLDNAQGMGIPATIALVVSILSIGVLCFRGVRHRQRDNVYPAAGVAAIVLIGLHSVSDFTMQVPAVAATFALLAGVCCAQSWSSLVRRVARTGK